MTGADTNGKVVGSTRVDSPSAIITREGWPIIGVFLGAGVLLTGLAFPVAGTSVAWVVGVLCGLLMIWCIWFFRDPARRIPGAQDGREPVISPADGVVCDIRPASPPGDLGVPFDAAARMTRVSVFMNVFNVHVNRAPVACSVVSTVYTPGKFFNASFDKASEHNERMGLRLRLRDGREMACVQIAGLIARRIVCRVKAGAQLEAGERFGIIRFGSRVDTYLPAGVSPAVKVGDRTVAGETVLGWLEVSAGAPVSPGSAAVKQAKPKVRSRV